MPRPEPSDWGLAPASFRDVVPGAVTFAVYLGGMALFVVMASFIGAEVTTGSLANWLTFVPHRPTVLVSKLVVVAGASVVIGALVGVVTVASSVAVTALHGQPLTGLDQVVSMAARGVVVVAIFGVLGFCIGLLTGSTGATVGVLLGGIFLVFVRSVLVFSSSWAQRLSPWSPEVNLSAILGGRHDVRRQHLARSGRRRLWRRLRGEDRQPGARTRLLGRPARRPDRGDLAAVPAPRHRLTGSRQQPSVAVRT